MMRRARIPPDSRHAMRRFLLAARTQLGRSSEAELFDLMSPLHQVARRRNKK
jgi:hypothetical protein